MSLGEMSPNKGFRVLNQVPVLSTSPPKKPGHQVDCVGNFLEPFSNGHWHGIVKSHRLGRDIGNVRKIFPFKAQERLHRLGIERRAQAKPHQVWRGCVKKGNANRRYRFTSTHTLNSTCIFARMRSHFMLQSQTTHPRSSQLSSQSRSRCGLPASNHVPDRWRQSGRRPVTCFAGVADQWPARQFVS